MMKNLNAGILLFFLSLTFISLDFSAYKSKGLPIKAVSNAQLAKKKESGLIYYNETALREVRKRISDGETYYAEALSEVLKVADECLGMDANPVVNKSMMPPSGDKHDYLSIAPYFWPNPDTKDGIPWVRRDGEVNSRTRGDDTDKSRLSKMLNAVTYLTFAFYYTGELKYAEKSLKLLQIWFVDPETKVNPNINYGQGVPGRTDGRPFGIIEWRGIANVITALQVFKDQRILDEGINVKIDQWLASYADWLLNSKLGKLEDTRSNNHGNWYDYQVVGILIYLGRIEEAKNRVEEAKQKRIAQQIEPDGSQPKELERTKSLSYSTMNLQAMTLVGAMAADLGVDLLHFSTDDDRSLLQAAKFLKPFAMGEKDWLYKQITPGGWQAAINDRLKPMFSIMSSIYKKRLIHESANIENTLSPLQRLQYPPLLYDRK